MTFICVNPFTLAAELAWSLRNLSRGQRHIKLRIHFQPALPCCTDNGLARQFLRHVQNLLLAQKISATSSDKFFLDGRAALVSEQVGSVSLYVSLLLIYLGTSNTFDVFFFQTPFITPNRLYGIRHFLFVPHFTLSSVHL